MKFVRFVVLAAMTSLPILSLPAVGQQEIDPDHFDQPAIKAAKPVTMAKASPKAASPNHQQKSATYAKNASRSTTGADQPKGEKRMAALRSTGE